MMMIKMTMLELSPGYFQLLSSDSEAQFVQHCLRSEWGEVPPLPSSYNLSHLLAFLYPLHQERINRLLATCLLFCSRYQDTSVSSCEMYKNMRIMKINLNNIRGSDPPVGVTGSGQVSCMDVYSAKWGGDFSFFGVFWAI